MVACDFEFTDNHDCLLAPGWAQFSVYWRPQLSGSSIVSSMTTNIGASGSLILSLLTTMIHDQFRLKNLGPYHKFKANLWFFWGLSWPIDTLTIFKWCWFYSINRLIIIYETWLFRIKLLNVNCDSLVEELKKKVYNNNLWHLVLLMHEEPTMCLN